MFQRQRRLATGVFQIGLIGLSVDRLGGLRGVGRCARSAAAGWRTRTARNRPFRRAFARGAAVGWFLLRRAVFGRVVLIGRLLTGVLPARLLPGVARTISARDFIVATICGGGPLVAFRRLPLGGAAGGGFRCGLPACVIAGLTGPLLIGRRRAFVGRRVRPGPADAGLIGLLAAALLTAAGTVARRFALGIGFSLACARRLGAVVAATVGCFAGVVALPLTRSVVLLRRWAAGIVTFVLAGAGRRLLVGSALAGGFLCGR